MRPGVAQCPICMLVTCRIVQQFETELKETEGHYPAEVTRILHDRYATGSGLTCVPELGVACSWIELGGSQRHIRDVFEKGGAPHRSAPWP